eukprot:8400392-Ditylum_brightwellii.AAC.1
MDQAKPTISMTKQSTMLMDYLAMYPNAVLQLFSGNMQLHVDSDTAYLVLNGAKSWIANYFYCVANPHTLNYNKTPQNAHILINCCTLKHVICLAAETEYSTLFHNNQTAMGLCNMLEAIGHPSSQQ